MTQEFLLRRQSACLEEEERRFECRCRRQAKFHTVSEIGPVTVPLLEVTV